MKQIMDYYGISGQLVLDQYIIFSCDRCEIKEADKRKVMSSGFEIKHTVSKDSNGKYWIHTRKKGNANNGVQTGAITTTSTYDAEVKN